MFNVLGNMGGCSPGTTMNAEFSWLVDNFDNCMFDFEVTLNPGWITINNGYPINELRIFTDYYLD